MTPTRFPARRVGIAAALIGSLALTGCQAEPAAPELQPVTLMLNWTPNAHHAGIYYAQQHGLYEAAGLDVSIIEPGDGIGAAASVAEGRVEFGISQAESLLPARAAGMDLQAVATLLPVNDSVLMGLTGSGLTTDPGSLAGLTYGGYGGALETEIISALASCGGGDPNEVEFIDIGNVDYLAGLAQQRFDVTWVFGGWDALRAEAERDDVVIVPLAEHESCIPNWYTPIIVGNGAAMSADPELAAAFLAATSSGYDAVAGDPGAGADALLAAAPELDRALVEAAVEYYAPRYTSQGRFGEMEEAVWQRFTEFLVSAEMLDDVAPLDGAWSNDYLPAG
ncbi:ABC transporter substrate-binding protein [Leucobacter komagatae]|uniref:ABC transporter substrate-binding protein n=1 Tax=Leucobacter komagatae TaxID=55969 RepID=UPI0005ACEED1|nr:ABC transporter substrate-binding protein [Leucobacter komagatae]